jgi:hypothetical protein
VGRKRRRARGAYRLPPHAANSTIVVPMEFDAPPIVLMTDDDVDDGGGCGGGGDADGDTPIPPPVLAPVPPRSYGGALAEADARKRVRDARRNAGKRARRAAN